MLFICSLKLVSRSGVLTIFNFHQVDLTFILRDVFRGRSISGSDVSIQNSATAQSHLSIRWCGSDRFIGDKDSIRAAGILFFSVRETAFEEPFRHISHRHILRKM